MSRNTPWNATSHLTETRPHLAIGGLLLCAIASLAAAPTAMSATQRETASCFENIGLRSTWILNLTSFKGSTDASQLRGTFLEFADDGTHNNYAFTAKRTTLSPETQLLSVAFSNDLTPAALTLEEGQSAKHIWKIRRYASEPDRTELTMSVRNRVVKPNDKDNQLDTTYTVTFERCSARSLSLIATKAKLP